MNIGSTGRQPFWLTGDQRVSMVPDVAESLIKAQCPSVQLLVQLSGPKSVVDGCSMSRNVIQSLLFGGLEVPKLDHVSPRLRTATRSTWSEAGDLLGCWHTQAIPTSLRPLTESRCYVSSKM